MSSTHPSSSHSGSTSASPEDGAITPNAPGDAEPGHDDGVLDSIGKAITSPVRGAAEPEEPDADERKAPVPPG